MDWKSLYLKIMPNIDFWGNYISKRTALEKEDVQQQLLLRTWEIYCEKNGDMTVAYIQYCLKYASIRIFHNYFRCNEVMLSVLSIESVKEEQLEHKDVEFYLQAEYVETELRKIVEKEYGETSKKCAKILDYLLEGKKQEEIAALIGYSLSKVKFIINSKIKPIIAKKY